MLFLYVNQRNIFPSCTNPGQFCRSQGCAEAAGAAPFCSRTDLLGWVGVVFLLENIPCSASQESLWENERPQCKLLDFIIIVIIYIRTRSAGKQKISPRSRCNALREKFTSKIQGFLWAALILFLLPLPWLDPERCWLCTETQRKELSCNSQLVHLCGFATLLQKCECDLKTSDLCFPHVIKITWHWNHSRYWVTHPPPARRMRNFALWKQNYVQK